MKIRSFSMLHYIEKLQTKPEYIRKRILVAIVVVCMSIIGFVWVSTFSLRFGGGVSLQEDEQAPSPFAVIKESGKTFSLDFNRGIEQLKEQFGQ
ncbi:MAG: hypothetical protein AAB773_01840 [Patescibacteria group bacterium]